MKLLVTRNGEAINSLGEFETVEAATEKVFWFLDPMRPSVVGIGFELRDGNETAYAWDHQFMLFAVPIGAD